MPDARIRRFISYVVTFEVIELKQLCIIGPCSLTGIKQHLHDAAYSKLTDAGIKGTGGVPIISLIDELIKQGWKIELISLDKTVDDNSIVTAEGDNFRVHFVKKYNKSSTNFYKYETSKILEVVESLPSMTIHSHWPIYSLGVINKYNERTLVSLHDHPFNCLRYLGFNHIFHFLATHYIYLKAKNVAVVSSHIKKYADHFRSKPVDIIRNFINVGSYSEPKNQLIEKYFVCIGNDSPLKNIEDAIKAFLSINSVEFTLNLYGPGLHRKSGFYQKLANKYDLTRVKFNGVVSHELLYSSICSSAGVIHPSKEEALPGPIIEAVLAMRPIITNPVGDTPFLLEQGHLGYIGDGSVSSLINGLNLVVSGEYFNRYDLNTSRNKMKIKLSNNDLYEMLVNKYQILEKNI